MTIDSRRLARTLFARSTTSTPLTQNYTTLSQVLRSSHIGALLHSALIRFAIRVPHYFDFQTDVHRVTHNRIIKNVTPSTWHIAPPPHSLNESPLFGDNKNAVMKNYTQNWARFMNPVVDERRALSSKKVHFLRSMSTVLYFPLFLFYFPLPLSLISDHLTADYIRLFSNYNSPVPSGRPKKKKVFYPLYRSPLARSCFSPWSAICICSRVLSIVSVSCMVYTTTQTTPPPLTPAPALIAE